MNPPRLLLLPAFMMPDPNCLVSPQETLLSRADGCFRFCGSQEKPSVGFKALKAMSEDVVGSLQELVDVSAAP